MNKKRMKPMANTTFLQLGLLGVSVGLYYYGENMAASLVIVLILIIQSVNWYLLTSSTLFLKQKVNKKQLMRYRNFAKSYLQNRRLKYSKQTFEEAIACGWFDIVTMCLLMGIKQYYKEDEQTQLMSKVIQEDQKRTFEILVRGGFSGNFIMSDTGEHFIYKVIRQQDPEYLKILLSTRVNPNQKNDEGETPIYEAIRQDYVSHVDLLVQHKADLYVKNREGLNPLFYALKQGRVSCSEKILSTMMKHEKPHQIEFKRLGEPLLVNPKLEPDDYTELLMQLIASKDHETLELLKDYFSNKQAYHLDVHTGVDLYARLTTLRASMEKKQVKSQKGSFMEKEEDCKKDLYEYILKHYKCDHVEQLNIQGIYNEPKIIDSHKEACEVCKGTGHVKCVVCDAKGKVECPQCKGKGKHTCTLCNGTKKVSCEKIKKYLECQECKDGEYTCSKCDKNGLHLCLECKGHGTEKCKCPPDKKVKCVHCDNGYIALKNGMYKKCSQCKDGLICSMCGNTGWVKERYKDKGYKCKACKGEKKVLCTVCRGKKKVKCAKRYEAACVCQSGDETCKVCGGNKTVSCSKCQGTGKALCSACDKGYIYTHIAIDFKAHQELVAEKVISQTKEDSHFKKLQKEMISYVVQNHPTIHTVYTAKKIDMQPKDVLVRNNHMQNEIVKMLEKLEGDRILDVLELIPLDYTCITFKHREGNKTTKILLNGQYFS